ncbi:uncharacterized protein [Choristoneura fumiferana]|uniref:uncharacterized protein n=1 Tax=Choristoneura fumiferana TaxID=7141 RepID=UPI003D153A99
MLITVVGDETYSLMCDLCSPALPETKKYEELVSLVQEHLEPKRSEIAERHLFRLRRQRPDETLMEYLQALKHLAATCNFGKCDTCSTLEENLRDQFVSGLANDAMRSRIFAEKKVTYRDAVELALSLEAAEKHAEVSGSIRPAGTSGAGGGEAGEGLNYARGGRGQRKCKAHRAERCKYAHYNCDECSQRGHLKVMCKQVRGGRDRGDKRHNYMSDESDEMFNIEVSTQGREWLRALEINNIRLHAMIEDGFVNQLCAEFPEVFTDQLGTCKRTIRLQLTDSEPVYARARAVPLALRARVERELARLEADGSVYRVEYSDYAAKRALLSKRVLAHYEEGRPLVLSVDSSAYGLGAVLAHRYPDGSERPVSCVSRTLSSAEQNYSQLDKEALAILFGVTKHHQIVIPTVLRKQVLHEIHEGHLGVNKMKNLSRGYVYWPSLDRDLEELCRACGACRAVRDAAPRAPMHPWEFPLHPWQRLHADFADCAGRRYLIVVDAHSKWIEAIEMQKTDARSTINAFRNMFARFGLPSQLVTDNGPPFFSQEFKVYCKMNNIRHVTSAPYRPQCNGAAENAVKNVKKAIKRAVHEGDDVATALNRFLFQHRNCEHATTGVSPAVALQGRRLRGRLDALRPDVAAVAHAAQERQARAAAARRDIRWRRHADQIVCNKDRFSLTRTSTVPQDKDVESSISKPNLSNDVEDDFEDASDGSVGEDERDKPGAGAGETEAVTSCAMSPRNPRSPSLEASGASSRTQRALNRAKRAQTHSNI